MFRPVSRRFLITSLGSAPVLLAPYTSIANPAEAMERRSSIKQPDTPSPAAFIERAFEMKEKGLEAGDRGYGAVVVQDGKIISQSASRVNRDHDATAHAELTAVRDACKHLKSSRLQGAVLYSSSPPCPMCEAAAYWAGVTKFVYGKDARDGGPPKLCG